MLISRCAWHRRYHGYTKILGVTNWEGLQLSFTDGICQKCAARVRADHLRARFDRGASADRRQRVWMPGLAALSLAIMVALVLIARPTHELPPLPPVVAVLPPAPVEVPAVDEPSPQPTERVRAAATRVVTHPARPARHPLAVEHPRVAWSLSTRPRVVPVHWPSSPYRSLAPRETAQSP
jgi:hypothetical protein